MRQSGAIVAVVLVMTTRPAEARQAVSVQVPPVEVGVGLTVNGLFHDVNAAPDCATLPAPCTHEHAERIAGFGAEVSLARNVNGHLAAAGARRGGADVLFPSASGHGQAHTGRDLTLRLVLDYRLTPGSGRNQSGWRFVVGVVFGPHA